MFLWTRGMQFCHSRRNVSHKTAKRFHSVTQKIEKKNSSAEKTFFSKCFHGHAKCKFNKPAENYFPEGVFFGINV